MDHKAKTELFIGDKGLDKSWQKAFEPEIECVHCGGTARPAFVVFESFGEPKTTFVTDLHKNDPDGEGLWPHDCVAIAVYLCKKCLEPTAKYNQA